VSEDVPAYGSRIQRFNRTNISMHDFEHAMKFMDAAAEHGTESPEYEALFMAAIALYARSFSSNERGSAMASTRLHLDPAAILGNQHELHVQVIPGLQMRPLSGMEALKRQEASYEGDFQG
jgi:hypothetical protein